MKPPRPEQRPAVSRPSLQTGTRSLTTRTSPAPAGLLRLSLHCLAFAVALGSAGAALAKDVTWEDIANDDKTTGDVLQYGMGTHAQRWSPLKQVNADNVFKLTPAWSYSFGDEKQRGQESQAIVSDGVIYVTASYSRLFALDAKTGKRLWTYNHRLPDDIRPCCDVVNRGAAIYGDKVFFGTLDASVVALNKNTGKVVWKKKFADHGAGYTMTGAPTIVKDGKTGKVLLIHGSSGDEFGVVGRLFARDPDTGEEIWMRPFVEGHMGRLNGKDSTVTGDVKAPSWPDDRNSPTGKVESWSHGGGAPWQSASFDAETNTIIVGAGNPGPWNTWARTAKGGNPHDYDSLYTSGQVRGGPEQRRGEVVLPAHPQRRLGLLRQQRTGAVRLQGQGRQDRQGHRPRRPQRLLLCGRPQQRQVAERLPLRRQHHLGQPHRPEDRPPGGARGPAPAAAGTGAEAWQGGGSIAAVPRRQELEPDGLQPGHRPVLRAGQPLEGRLLDRGGQLYEGQRLPWHGLPDQAHVRRPRRQPARHGPGQRQGGLGTQGTPAALGRVLATAGNLVFTGTGDGYFKAFDAKSGKELWKFQTGSGIVSPPITWEQDGEQYLGVTVGYGGAVPLWGGDMADLTRPVAQGGSFWVFKLPSWDNRTASR